MNRQGKKVARTGPRWTACPYCESIDLGYRIRFTWCKTCQKRFSRFKPADGVPHPVPKPRPKHPTTITAFERLSIAKELPDMAEEQNTPPIDADLKQPPNRTTEQYEADKAKGIQPVGRPADNKK